MVIVNFAKLCIDGVTDRALVVAILWNVLAPIRFYICSVNREALNGIQNCQRQLMGR
jgi:hypothetical protein